VASIPLERQKEIAELYRLYPAHEVAEQIGVVDRGRIHYRKYIVGHLIPFIGIWVVRLTATPMATTVQPHHRAPPIDEEIDPPVLPHIASRLDRKPWTRTMPAPHQVLRSG
jgi:hypothetical protein